MVQKGSVKKTSGTLDISFLVTDYKHTVPVKYTGILPDLFREGQGVVAHGRMQSGTFVADEILAKHDERYMAPEVAESLKNNPPPPDMPAAGASGAT
jgi:cytochrome c-type biogenesis protein CcmE